MADLQSVETSMPKPQLTALEDKTKSELTVTAASSGTAWTFDLTSGNLSSWKHAEFPFAEKLVHPITMDFYRALTDNDRGGHGGEWTDRRLHQTAPHLRHIEWTDDQDGITVKVKQRIAPPVLAWAVDATWTYHFRGETLAIHVQGEPHGVRLPSTFARIGITMSMQGVDTAKWWGRGPGESYRDKKESQLFGNWESSVDDLFVDYDFPQDGGNRADVRKVSFFGGGRRAMAVNFGDLDGASFSASRYSTKDVNECTHPYELRERRSDSVHVRLDWAHHGLGTGSCGPWTLEQYQLKTDPFEYSLLIDFSAE